MIFLVNIKDSGRGFIIAVGKVSQEADFLST